MNAELVVADLTEEQLLARIVPLLPAGAATIVGPGDDAAVVAAADGRFVVSADVLVEGHHFRRDWSTATDVGWRAAMQNLADIAAMGARPTSLTVSLVAPPDLPVRWAEDMCRGMALACAEVDAGVVGGDLSSGEQLVVAVTVHGDLDGLAPVLRSGARVGDVVAHAGVRGRAAAGLALLHAGRPEVDPALVDQHRRPVSPLTAGPAASRAGATAMIDLSDGLTLDARRLGRASGTVIALDAPQQAFGADLARLTPAATALGVDPRAWVLSGGEDHGLLATFPRDVPLPVPFRPVGRVIAADGAAPGVTVAGEVPRGALGWDHFHTEDTADAHG